MSEEPKKELPEAVRKIVEGMVSQALARCDQLGITHEDFYRAMRKERKIQSTGDLAGLLERTFHRLASNVN